VGNATFGLQEVLHPTGLPSGVSEARQIFLTAQEPTLRECLKELPSEETLPTLCSSSNFQDFWMSFETLAKGKAWPIHLVPGILAKRASDSIEAKLKELHNPSSLQEVVKVFLRRHFFQTVDFSAVRSRITETKQYLRESIEEWQKRLEKINDGQIELDNVEGLMIYRNAVLPVYREEEGSTINEFIQACIAREMKFRQVFGDQVFRGKPIQRGNGYVVPDYVNQLTAYERKLMYPEEHTILERLRNSDMALGKAKDLKAAGHINNVAAATNPVPTSESSRSKSRKQCSHCHRVGHAVEDCWFKHPEKRLDRPQKRARIEIDESYIPTPAFPGHCVFCAMVRPHLPSLRNARTNAAFVDQVLITLLCVASDMVLERKIHMRIWEFDGEGRRDYQMLKYNPKCHLIIV
jgi:hypothetical protein